MYITEKLKEICNETNELVFSMGAAYNDIKRFSKVLKDALDAGDLPYIIISCENHIRLIYGGNIQVMIRALDDFASKGSEKTSWQIAVEVFDS